MHQTLSIHVTPHADTTLQSIYKTISQSYYRKPSPDSAGELQSELEGLKRTLVASRRATALQFLCFRKIRTEEKEKEEREKSSVQRGPASRARE
jgi:exocyst complex component 2